MLPDVCQVPTIPYRAVRRPWAPVGEETAKTEGRCHATHRSRGRATRVQYVVVNVPTAMRAEGKTFTSTGVFSGKKPKWFTKSSVFIFVAAVVCFALLQ